MRLVLILSLLFFSCSSSREDSDSYEMKRRKVSEYYISSGVIRYFLPEVPYWANFSTSGQCHRKTSIKYLDMEKVRGSLSLSYEEAIQLQLMFNNFLQVKKRKNDIEHIPFKDEEGLFFKASEQIQAGIRSFRIPKYKKVSLLWLDLFEEKGRGKRVKKIMNSDRFSQGHPIFMSLCMTRMEMETWLAQNGLTNKNIRLISYELLSPFNLDGTLGFQYFLNVNEILKEKKIKLFIPKKSDVPKGIVGRFKIQKI